jgi:hypothetical protein
MKVFGAYVSLTGLGLLVMPALVLSLLGMAALCLALVLAVSAPMQLLLFGAVDVAGALWTSHGLRKPA